MFSLESLFPKHRIAWIVWLLLVALIFPLYYICVFPKIYRAHESFWDDSERGWGPRTRIESGKGPDGKREFQWRVPYYVSDFVEVPLYVKIRNISNEDIPQTVVSVVATQKATDFIVSIDGVRKNSVALESMPPGGEQVTKLMVRSLSKEESYTIELKLGDQPVNSYDPIIEFDRGKVLCWWVRKHLLSPPGANVLLPIVLLIWVALGEVTCKWGRSAPNKKYIQQDVVNKLISPPGILLTALLVILFLISVYVRLYWYYIILLFITITFVAVGALMGWLDK